jgi:NAD+ kinase
MSKKKFQQIVIMARPGAKDTPETLLALKNYLQSLNVNMVMLKQTAAMINEKQIPIVEPETIPPNSDLIIVVGGDGSLINAAHVAIQYHLPVLGINRGRLGFLTDIHPDELTKVGEVLAGHYQEEQRFLLNAEILNSQNIQQDAALNEVALLPSDHVQMVEFDIMIDEQFVCRQRADGLIIATPTGSTAYALSGGGPILHPRLNAVVLVPMFPHTLSSRPIVISNDSVIDLYICNTNQFSSYMSCDGQKRMEVQPEDRIHVTKKSQQLRLIHPEDYSYFTTLREKLGWEKRMER